MSWCSSTKKSPESITTRIRPKVIAAAHRRGQDYRDLTVTSKRVRTVWDAERTKFGNFETPSATQRHKLMQVSAGEKDMYSVTHTLSLKVDGVYGSVSRKRGFFCSFLSPCVPLTHLERPCFCDCQTTQWWHELLKTAISSRSILSLEDSNRQIREPFEISDSTVWISLKTRSCFAEGEETSSICFRASFVSEHHQTWGYVFLKYYEPLCVRHSILPGAGNTKTSCDKLQLAYCLRVVIMAQVLQPKRWYIVEVHHILFDRDYAHTKKKKDWMQGTANDFFLKDIIKSGKRINRKGQLAFSEFWLSQEVQRYLLLMKWHFCSLATRLHQVLWRRCRRFLMLYLQVYPWTQLEPGKHCHLTGQAKSKSMWCFFDLSYRRVFKRKFIEWSYKERVWMSLRSKKMV